MIKAIIFDCFGVLTDGDNWTNFRNALPANQREAMRELNRSYNQAEISYEQMTTLLSKALNKTSAETKQLLDDLGSDQNKNIALLEYIQTLKPKYKIGILSNVGSNWITDELLTEKEEQELFDDMVFSFAHGFAKPDPRIFKIACERLNVEPQEAVFIDDINDFCKAAEGTGMKSLNYKDFDQMKKDLEKLLDSNN